MKLVPLKLKELHKLQAQSFEEKQQNQNQNSRPFAHLNHDINTEETETRKHSKKRGIQLINQSFIIFIKNCKNFHQILNNYSHLKRSRF